LLEKVPSKVDFVDLEHDILDFWEENEIFNKLREKNSDGERWRFIDGPITANNPMGVHHAWGRTYKDVFHRYKAMQGFKTRYQNGFDCQGLWVEVEVEKELGFDSKTDIEDYGVEKFVNKCKQRVKKYSQKQTEQSKRLGYWMDWDNSYYTMSNENNFMIWNFLKECHDRDWIYKGHDVMPWCPRCGAALSEHEIATEGYKEMTHTSVTVKLPLLERDNEYLLIWTTTPWTLTSNVAAAVNPEITYIKVKQENEIYYIAQKKKGLLEGKYEILDELSGQELLGIKYEGPFDELDAQEGIEHKVIEWDEVTAEEGTGIVHIAPGCGEEDYELGEEYDLDVIAPIDEFGNYIEGFNWLTGKNVADVTENILEDLDDKGIKYKEEDYTHRYPVCWRHGTPLVFRLVEEWFIDMDELREDMMEVTKQIDWMPDYGMDRELDWLRNMDDWMISKKRFWGLALPIYECEECGHVTVVGGDEELKEKAVEGWEEFEGHSPHKPWIDEVKIECEECGEKVNRIGDVGNPWLDAGIVPFSTLKYRHDKEYWEKWFPADFICESLPGQFRNWFYALIAMSTVLENEPPFKRVLGYKLVKDENGDEMHKSTGNAIWFDDAAEEMGVDVMRWLYTSRNPFNNLNFGYNIAKNVRKKMITLWNSYSFFTTYASIDDYSPEDKRVDKEDLSKLDQWIMARLHSLFKQSEELYDDYDVYSVMQEVEDFIEDLSNWYIRRSRRRFWKSENDTDKLAAFQTLYKSLKGLIKIIAPVVPFVTEKIYQNLVKGLEKDVPESIHLTEFPEYDEKFIDEDLIEQVDTIIKIVSMGRAARNKADIKIRQPLPEIFIRISDNISFKDSLTEQVKKELNIKKVTYIEDDSKFANYIVKPHFASLKEDYGDKMSEIVPQIQSLPQEETAKKLEKGGTIELSLENDSIYLDRDYFLLEREDKENYSTVIERDYSVALDTRIDDELDKEGIVRDLVRYVQVLRKEADFEVDDRIEIAGEFTGKIGEAIEDNLDYLKGETLSKTVYKEDKNWQNEKRVKLDGQEIKISVKKVSK